jgi:outer membrane protein OmpA-like peptidoglycan-associated protein
MTKAHAAAVRGREFHHTQEGSIMFQKRILLVLGLVLVLAFGNACATKKFVVRQVDTSIQASEQKTNARLDTHESNIQANTNQIGELVATNKEHSQRIEALRGDVKAVDGKAAAAGQAAENAQKAADSVGSSVTALDSRFQSRNKYGVVAEKVVQFKFGDWKLQDSQTAELDDAARMLVEDANAVAVLEGRTDSIGDKEYNIQLGQRRLEAVARYLVVEKEVPAFRIHKMSFGADRPVADNKTREGRAQNRTTVVKILSPQSAIVEQTSSR